MNTLKMERYRKQVACRGGKASAVQIDYGVGETYEVAVNLDGYWEPVWRGDERPSGLLLLIREIQDDPRNYSYSWTGCKWLATSL